MTALRICNARIAMNCILCLCVLFLGCQNPAREEPRDQDSKETNYSGDVFYSSDWGLSRALEVASNQFSGKYPDVEITPNWMGSSISAIQKNVDIVCTSKPISPRLLSAFSESKTRFVEIPIGLRSIFVIVNRKNSLVDHFNQEQLRLIFQERVIPVNWSDLKSGWPNRAVKIFLPGTGAPGVSMLKTMIIEEGLGVTNSERVTHSEFTEKIISGVADDQWAIGLISDHTLLEKYQEQITAIPIFNAEEGKVYAPTLENIRNSKYQLTTSLLIYASLDSIESNAACKGFLEFLLSNPNKILEGTRVISLNLELYKKGRQHITDRLTGTHFFDSNGSPKRGSLNELFDASERISEMDRN